MNNIELIFSAIGFGLTVALLIFTFYFWGYSRGMKAVRPDPVIDPTPVKYQGAEKLIDNLVISEVGHLEVTTGPISLPVLVEAVDARDILIDKLRHDLVREHGKVLNLNKLRHRYLQLLKEERAMMLQVIQGRGVTLTPYWNRWVRRQFTNEKPFWTSPGWSRIANIAQPSDSSSH